MARYQVDGVRTKRWILRFHTRTEGFLFYAIRWG